MWQRCVMQLVQAFVNSVWKCDPICFARLPHCILQARVIGIRTNCYQALHLRKTRNIQFACNCELGLFVTRVVCYGPCYSRTLYSASLSSVSQLLDSMSTRQHVSNQFDAHITLLSVARPDHVRGLT